MSEGGGGTAEEAASKAAEKRYESLVTVRNKAVKGKGAWYWAHLEPLLVYGDNGLPKAVKLKCCLCDTVFSASNPSRTASEHLKRGTCPSFSSPGTTPRPVADNKVESLTTADEGQSLVTLPLPQYHHQKRRRRASSSSFSSAGGGTAAGVGVGGGGGGGRAASNTNTNATTTTAIGVMDTSYVPPISVVLDPPRFSLEMSRSEVGYSGGGGALVVHPHHQNSRHLTPPESTGGVNIEGVSDAKMFEDSIKKLKSPKIFPGPTLSKTQIESALDCLSEWVYESCGSVSFSSLEHPKFKSFLHQVGLNEVSKTEIFGSRLDSRFEVVRNESNSRIKDAVFFQVASHGWKSELRGFDDYLVSLSANLPSGTSVCRKAVFMLGQSHGKLSEEALWETIVDVCGNSVRQCVGIVADGFKSATLRNLESQYHWMVNLSCQCRAFNSLIKDFYCELPLFKNVADSCRKLANFVQNKTLRNCLHKYETSEFGLSGLFRMSGNEQEFLSFEPVYVMIKDIMSSARALESVLLDESYKIASMEDPIAREFGEMVGDAGFWNDLEAVRSLVKLVKEMANDFETERPLVGQCLPLWEELRSKVKDWCTKFHVADVLVDKVIEKRFRKNYHPAWAAAYVLDPFYMIQDPSGRYLPPFKCLSPEQQKDVHDLVARLVSRDEVPIALSELMRWRSNGLDPVYAQAVQLKQRDPNSGKMRVASPQGSRLVWETYLPEFETLRKVALKLIFLHATAHGFKCNTSLLKWVQNHGRSRLALDKAQKMIFIAAHSKLERRDFTMEDDKDAELFASVHEASGYDSVGLEQPP